MKKITIILISLICSITAMAALTDKQQQDIINEINKTTSELKSMSCSFTQTKYLSLLSDKMVSQGMMYYNKSNRLRWEYTSPYQYLFVFNGTQVYVGGKSRKDVIDTNTNKVFKEIARIMMSTVTGTALSNTNDFITQVTDDNKYYIVTLVPKKKEIKKMVFKIILYFNKTNHMIAEVNIYEKNNDWTNIKMMNITTNEIVNEALFNIPK